MTTLFPEHARKPVLTMFSASGNSRRGGAVFIVAWPVTVAYMRQGMVSKDFRERTSPRVAVDAPNATRIHGYGSVASEASSVASGSSSSTMFPAR
jgi:hypothetical protein